MDINKLKAKIIEQGETPLSIAEFLNIDIATYYRKVKNENFTIREANKMAQKLQMSNKEAIDIFLCPKNRKIAIKT